MTGANSGLGKVAATALAVAGAEVVMACRSVERGEAARAAVDDPGVRARLRVARLDLADLASVSAFAAGERARGGLDLLMNNAGLMLVPTRRPTTDGFELQMGVNHLGHFALTRELWPALVAGRGRVVALTSIARRFAGPLDPGLGELGPYAAFHAYAQSKLACLLFAQELDRRAAGSGVTAVAAHPGYCRTDLFGRQQHPSLSDRLTAVVTPFVGSSPRHGVRSQLRAATDPALTGGELVGPRLWIRGAPVLEDPGPNTDAAAASMLWELSEEKTGARFDV